MTILHGQMKQTHRASHFKLFCWYWLPVLLYAGLIVYVSSLSLLPDDLPLGIDSLSDKIWHAMEYAVLGVLCYRALLHAAGARLRSMALPLAILAATVFGLTDEVHQWFVPHRQADGWDLLADAVGATAAVTIWGRLGYSQPHDRCLAGHARS